MLYLDHAATALPKAPEVFAAMEAALGLGNPGRSGHRGSLDGARAAFRGREILAGHLGVGDPRRLVYTAGCTAAINTALFGLLGPGGVVVTTALEHNAVSRPLRALEAHGIELRIVGVDPEGLVDPAAFQRAAQGAALAVVNHVSNVSGTVQDLSGLREATRGLPLLVDGAQGVGHLAYDLDGDGLDYLAVPGHKGLRGPPGIGALCLGAGAAIPAPLIHGGTGSRSEQDVQPDFLPDALEGGTQNIPGVAGLAAAVAGLDREALAAVRAREFHLMARFLDGLDVLPRLQVLGPRDPARRVAVFGLVLDGMDPGTAALRMEREHGILGRAGLQCAPWAHRAFGTFPQGSLRLSFGPENTDEDVDQALTALAEITR